MKKHLLSLLLSALLLVLCAMLLFGCSKYTPEKTVSQELSLIQQLDEETIKAFVSYEDMMHSVTGDTSIGEETTEAVELFFKNFKYKILSSSSNDKTSIVNVEITNLDTKELAKDLYLAILVRTVAPNDHNEDLPLSMNAYFTLLRDILLENTYELVSTTAHFDLIKTDAGWSIQGTERLEDELVSGFITYLNDPYLLSPEELTVSVLDKFKELTPQEWIDYLGMNDIFATGTSLYEKIDLAFAEQITAHFDYTIHEAAEKEKDASVKVVINSLDMQSVLSEYMDRLMEYAETTEAIRDTNAELADKTSAMLLECLQSNKKSMQKEIIIEFINTGTNWDMQLNNDFTDALLGNLNEALEDFEIASQ